MAVSVATDHCVMATLAKYPSAVSGSVYVTRLRRA